MPVRLARLNRPCFPPSLSSSSPVVRVLPVGLVFARALGALLNAISIRLVRLHVLGVLTPELRNPSRLSGAVRSVCLLVSLSGRVCLGLVF